MQVQITLTDKGARTVSYDMEALATDGEYQTNTPTPAVVFALVVKALFESRLLEELGQVVLEGVAAGIAPATYLKEKCKVELNEHPNT